jgi:tetratricopeptide (TPR) repeat protein
LLDAVVLATLLAEVGICCAQSLAQGQRQSFADPSAKSSPQIASGSHKATILLLPETAKASATLDGQSDQAIAHAEQAICMSPHDPQNALFNVALAGAHYVAGRYNDAIIYGRKAMQQRFGLTNGHRIYIASLAQAGQIDEARAALAKLQEIAAWTFHRLDRTEHSLYAGADGQIP